MMNFRPILLVEDDDVDVIATKKVLQDLKVTSKLIHKSDGENALEYLRDQSNQKPCVILLDLNMPKMDGFEFLKITKADNILKRIPVMVLTTSAVDQNIVESFDLGVAGYIVKSAGYKQFVEAMRTVHMYWTLSRLPHIEQ